jgi:hypothetical protein
MKLVEAAEATDTDSLLLVRHDRVVIARSSNFNGWLGQYLVVYPRSGVVAVRQRREPPDVRDEDNARIGMKSFTELVRATFVE